jgi:hypothetical protein
MHILYRKREFNAYIVLKEGVKCIYCKERGGFNAYIVLKEGVKCVYSIERGWLTHDLRRG